MASTELSVVIEQAKRAAKQEQEHRPLTHKDVETAWKILCPKGSTLTRSEAEELLTMMYPGKLGAKQLRHLVPADGVSCEWLQQLLVGQPTAVVQAVDVCEQAFRVLDPACTGAVDMEVLKRLMQQLHHVEELSQQEVSMLMQLADVDLDGKISLQDFMLLYNKHQQEAAAASASTGALLKQQTRKHPALFPS